MYISHVKKLDIIDVNIYANGRGRRRGRHDETGEGWHLPRGAGVAWLDRDRG